MAIEYLYVCVNQRGFEGAGPLPALEELKLKDVVSELKDILLKGSDLLCIGEVYERDEKYEELFLKEQRRHLVHMRLQGVHC